ncbi:MAG: hypothetical protein Q7S31_02820 [bacterium]|nr:hypothetical protein [bacterium]
MYLTQITGIAKPAGLNPDLFVGDILNVGGLVSRILIYAIIAAGLFFFVRLLSGGYKFLTSSGDSAKIAGATKELTNAAIGLVVVITSFFLAQILEVIFGINIL